MFQKDQTGKGKQSRAAVASDNRPTEQTYQKCLRCGSGFYLIPKCPKPPKYNEKRRKQVRFNEKCNRAYNNGKNDSDQKIYVSMARMSGNNKYPSGKVGDKWKLTNEATCHMTPEVSDLIPGSLEDTDKHIEVAYGHHVTEKKKGQV